MNQQQIIDAFQGLMPQIKTAGEPEPVLLKYAADHNLVPALLEKLAQVYNTARALNVMNKASSEEARGRTFKIIDVPDLLARYTEWTPPATKAGFSADARSWLEMDPEKNAHERVPDMIGEALNAPMRDMSKVAAAAPRPEPQVSALQKKADAKHNIDILRGAIVTCERKLNALFERQKSAAWRNENLAGEILKDVEIEIGTEQARAVMEKFSRYLAAHHIPQNGINLSDTRLVRSDRHNALEWVKAAHEQMEEREAAIAYCFHLVKEAAMDPDVLADLKGKETEGDTFTEALEGAESASSPPGGEGFSFRRWTRGDDSVSESEGSDKADKAPKKKDKERVLTRDTQPPAGKAPKPKDMAGDALSNMITGHTDALYRNQLIADKATKDLQAATVLQRLLLTHPILSEADPQLVVSQFNTIRKSNPDLALDPNLLAFALTEAVQYGGVPLHTYDQMLETRNKARRIDQKSDDKGKGGTGLNLNLLGL